MIEHNYHTVETIFYAMQTRPNYERDMPQVTREEIERMEKIRMQLPRTVLPVLGMARRFASQFPEEAVEGKVTAEWLLKRAQRSQPEVARLIREYGKKGRRWLDEEARQIRMYLLGKLTYDPALKRMVEVRRGG